MRAQLEQLTIVVGREGLRSVSVNRSQVLPSTSGRLRMTLARSASHQATVPRGSSR